MLVNLVKERPRNRVKKLTTNQCVVSELAWDRRVWLEPIGWACSGINKGLTGLERNDGNMIARLR